MNRRAEAEKLAPGSDLWIIPEKQNSKMTQKLDWYLNFQIAKSSIHQSAQIPIRVLDILKKCELENHDWANESKEEALLVWAQPFLPCRWVVMLGDSREIEQWTRLAVQKWKGLNSPSVKVFLPHHIDTQEFEKIWKLEGGTDSVVIVPETEDEIHG